MTHREQAFKAMRNGSLPDIVGSGTTIYGICIDTMTRDELLIALGWSLSQTARLLGPDRVGVLK